jgi:hypothetical protein
VTKPTGWRPFEVSLPGTSSRKPSWWRHVKVFADLAGEIVVDLAMARRSTLGALAD